MQRTTVLPRFRNLAPLFLLAGLAASTTGQDAAPSAVEVEERKLIVEPLELVLDVGATAQLSARVEDAAGMLLADEELMFFSRARRSVTVDSEGHVEAVKPGEFTLIVRTRRRGPTNDGGEGQAGRAELGERISVEIPVTVRRLPIQRLQLEPARVLYAGTVVELGLTGYDTQNTAQTDLEARLTSRAPEVAAFDAFGQLHVHSAGFFEVSASYEALSTVARYEVLPNPVHALILTAEAETARTGDVVHFQATLRDADGQTLTGVPLQVTVQSRLEDELGPPASGQVRPGQRAPGDFRFVAETPGLYTVVATCGARVAQASVRIERRKYDTKLELVGRGSVSDTHTSDLWVWEGVDGRDYAVTGTWGADGETHFWDVTKPAEIERIATVKVDARTVNDVKVSSDGRLCVISREGASDRKNGFVMIDVTNPREPEVVGSYDEGLTGGVHNVFIDGHHVYALSNGRRYDIVDVSDPATPRTIGSYELETPGHSIHDVWVEDGLAYSSNWADGVHIVDVGNGIRGGSPENPVFVGNYAYPSGWNHAAFPFRSADGRRFVVAGDEAFPFGLNITGKPTYPRGWLHFIDFTDLDDPQEVARYQVPEAGTHNLWIEDELLYVGYYNGGVRVVDISGELMGDLYRQGREMNFFLPDDPEGFIANAPMTWGPQPHKGRVFFSDWNSGLWCVELVQETGE